MRTVLGHFSGGGPTKERKINGAGLHGVAIVDYLAASPNMCRNLAPVGAGDQVITGLLIRLQDGRSASGIGSDAHGAVAQSAPTWRQMCLPAYEAGRGTTLAAAFRVARRTLSRKHSPAVPTCTLSPKTAVVSAPRGQSPGGHFQKPSLTGYMSEKAS